MEPVPGRAVWPQLQQPHRPFLQSPDEYGFTTIVRKTRGDDIDAACGQLAGDVIDRTKRTLRKRMQGEAIDVKRSDK